MGFDFKPSLWFVCRLCGLAFTSTETLKEHKLACHLGECLEIKCIVFEERLLTTEWIPEDNLLHNRNPIINSQPENKSLQECGNKIPQDYGSAIKEFVFKNPCVSLTRITEIEINPTLNQIRRRKQQRSSSESKAQDEESELESWKQEQCSDDQGDNNSGSKINDDDYCRYQPYNGNNDTPLQSEIQLKKESPINEVKTTENVVANEGTCTDLKNVQDPEFIVAMASVFPSSNEVQIQEQEPQTGGFNHYQQESASFLSYQSRSATSEVANSFMCKTCFAFFRSRNLLNSHMLRHSTIKPFKCSKCPSRFKRKIELKHHQIVHGEETKFKCRFCSKSFAAIRSLREHERIHTGDKPFKCPVPHCGFAAYSSSNLSAHTRSRHSKELGLQQFVCSACGKTYGIKRQLDIHFRNHHSDFTPFY